MWKPSDRQGVFHQVFSTRNRATLPAVFQFDDTSTHPSSFQEVSRAAKGFSLVELLIVISIMAVIASLAIVSFNNDNYKRHLKGEAERLALVMRLAADESIFLGKELGVQFLEDGYRFVLWEDEQDTIGQLDSAADQQEDQAGDESAYQIEASADDVEETNSSSGYTGSWVLMQGDRAFRAHRFEHEFEFYIEIEDGEPVELLSDEEWEREDEEEESTEEVYIDPNADPNAPAVYDPSKEKYPPTILLLSSGEMTPFNIDLYAEEDSDYVFTLKGDLIGNVKVVRPGEEDDF